MNFMKHIKIMFPVFAVILIAISSILLIGCGTNPTGGGSGGSSDNKPPAVISTVPTNDAAGVALNSKITATFSEKILSSTITSNTFTLSNETTGSTVECVLTYSSVLKTAILSPEAELAVENTYEARVTTGIKDLAGNALTAEVKWKFTTGSAADTTPPTVESTFPVDLATGVATTENIIAYFSELMNSSTITNETFILSRESTGALVPCTLTYVGTVAALNPISDLAANTTYEARITTAAMDLAGNHLAADHTWTFMTAAFVDTTPPTVESTFPADLATGVATTDSVTATFSETMNASVTTDAILSTEAGTAVPCVVTYSGLVVTLDPISDLAYNTTYEARITTGAKDLAGNHLAADHTWTFMTAAFVDTTPPTVESTFPADLATGVATTDSITATFSKTMNAAVTFEVLLSTEAGTAVPCSVTYSGFVVTLDPISYLTYSTTYEARITTGARDLSGNHLAADHTWSFTTSAEPSSGPAPVDLGTAGNFEILARSGIANTLPSTVEGDIGVSPIGYAAITGFGLIPAVPSGGNVSATSEQVSGLVYASDYSSPTPANLTVAVSDEQAAYTDASTRPATSSEVGGASPDIGGGVFLAKPSFLKGNHRACVCSFLRPCHSFGNAKANFWSSFCSTSGQLLPDTSRS
jgi:Bacterial Ig-like domain/Ice-binding-like